MSRIGKKGIIIPEKTEVTVVGNVVKVKGPLGELSTVVREDVAVSVEGTQVTLVPQNESLESAALWGTFASIINNMVEGVNKAFVAKLTLEGIGYKVEVKGDTVVLALGFSHPVVVAIPEGIKVVVEKNNITISGIEKQKVGEFAARLHSLKKPEPYKGKGMRYEGEVIKIKQGKKSV
jgi:large subunit ribosomal protein L6